MTVDQRRGRPECLPRYFVRSALPKLRQTLRSAPTLIGRAYLKAAITEFRFIGAQILLGRSFMPQRLDRVES
jgi:hypothetical protein